MAYQNNEKSLNADIDSAVFDAFEKQRKERTQVKKGAVTAALRLWVSLPEAVQGRLLNKTLSESAFIELLNEIFDERIEAGRQSGKALLEHQKRRPGQKG